MSEGRKTAEGPASDAARGRASHVAVDLGAGSGRVIRGRFGEQQLEFEELHRFAHEPTPRDGALRWSSGELFGAILEGLARASRSGAPIASVGVDTWGCDYALLDGAGQLLEEPISYRDARTDGVLERAAQRVPLASIYRATGIQLQPFNTLFQLFQHVNGPAWPRSAARLLPLPDLFHRLLCGSDSGERTHATTMQMVSAASGEWDRELLRAFGIPSSLLPRLVEAGTRLGPLKEEVARATGLERCEVVAPATHDTASAVAGTPLAEDVAFVSAGTWCLVGVERRAPLLDDAAFTANFTNEGGVGGTTRFLKNVAGMWLLEGCRASWRRAGRDLDWDDLEEAIERAPAWAGVVDPDDPAFFRPADMQLAVEEFLRATQQPVPATPGALARLLLESLALRCAEVIDAIGRLTGTAIRAVRVIGGASRIDFLNQALADVTGLAVIAGPVEATALGNLLVQAIAAGRFGDLAEGRAYIAQRVPSRHYQPRSRDAAPPLLARFRRVIARRAATPPSASTGSSG